MAKWPINTHPNIVMAAIAVGLDHISIGIVGLIAIGSDRISIGVDGGFNSGFDVGFNGGLFNQFHLAVLGY
jgi:hypothetical protein